jgi:uncharacterized membrane protein
MPAFVPSLVSWWAALYSGSAILRTLVAFVHIAGIVGGGGAAVVVDRATLRATRDCRVAGRRQIDAIHATHRIVLIGLTAVIVSGVLLFAADVETYAPSRLFWIKMGMVAALMINGTVLVGTGRGPRAADERSCRTLRWTAGISLALWFLTTLAGAGLPNI